MKNSHLSKLFILIITSLVVTIPFGAVAAPVKKTWDESAVTKVKDALRQISEAATLWEKSGGCRDRECTNADSLFAAGKLASAPKVPPGIGVANSNPAYTETGSRMGGCGPATPGAPRTLNPALYDVSEGFCRDYNNSVGLGSTIVENCGSGGDCTASGSTSPYQFPTVKSSTFCYRLEDIFAVVWMGTINDLSPCP